MWEYRPLRIVSPPQLEQQLDRKSSCLDTWIDRNLIRVPLETSALNEGAIVAEEEETPQEKKPGHRKRICCKQEPSKRKDGDTPLGRLFGTNSLKEGTM
jgi:hypothetical protein